MVPRIFAVIPALLTLLLIFLPLAALPVSLHGVAPQLFLAAIFFWSAHWPPAMPLWLALLTGLVADALTGLPLGMIGLVALCLAAWARRHRRYLQKQGFVPSWMMFSQACGVVLALLYLALCLYYWRLMEWRQPLLQAIFTLLLYPPLHGFFFFLRVKGEEMHG